MSSPGAGPIPPCRWPHCKSCFPFRCCPCPHLPYKILPHNFATRKTTPKTSLRGGRFRKVAGLCPKVIFKIYVGMKIESSTKTRGKSLHTVTESSNCTKNVFTNKHCSEGQFVTVWTDPRCQNHISKNHFLTAIPNLVHVFCKHFFAAQVPGCPRTAPSLPDYTTLA